MLSIPPTRLSLLSILLLLPVCLSFYLPDSNPLLSFDNQVREVHLYTDNHRRGMYLQMTHDGRVSGSDTQSLYSVMELKSVQPGQVVIKGQSTSLFLCAGGGGTLSGQSQFTEADCTFTELLLADGYTRFLSAHHGFPVSLAPKQSQDRPAIPFTRFLPLRNTLRSEGASEQPATNQKYLNVDSDDPLGMGLNAVVSPHFSSNK